MQEENILIQAGLSEEQAQAYQALLDRGPQRASDLSKWTGIKRGLIYKVLEQLESMGLISKKGGPGTVAVFSPSHPSLLLSNIERKEKEIALTKEMLTSSLGSLSSKFNLITGKPNVQFFEGLDGIQKVYDELVFEKKDILLIQSPFDAEIKEIDSMVQKQIEKQVAHNIHTKAITPLIETTKEWVKNKDSKNLVTRCIIPNGIFEIPAQIIIYSNKVGISSMKEPIITSIIEDKNISDTFKMIFEYIWQLSQSNHKKIIDSFEIPNNSQTT